jgi:hypothetical protein
VYDRRLWAVQDGKLKLIEGSDGTRSLYDLATDPGETTDCTAERPGALEELTDLLHDWRASLPETQSRAVGMDDRTRQRLEELGYLQ